MLFNFIGVCLCLNYNVKGTKLTISGDGEITQNEVLANCDSKSITDIIIEDGITKLCSFCFYRFTSLVTISLSNTVQEVDSTSTRYCWDFANWILSKSSRYLEVDEYAALYYSGKETLIRLPPQKKTYKIPRTVKHISAQAFHGMTYLSSLFIPNTVISIDYGILYDCNINEVIFESGSKIKIFQKDIFSWSSMHKIVIPASVEIIDSYAFQYTKYLSTVIFEEGSNLTEIRSDAFFISQLENFSFPNKTKKLGSSIFNMNSKLTKIFIPKSLTEIDPQTFTGCSSIATIEIDKNNQVYSVAEPATLMDKAKTKIFYVSPTVESINIVMSVKTISSTLLQSCTSLKDVFVSSESTTYSSSKGILYDKAQTKAIACAGGIKDAVIVSSCKTIESYCFYSMINLQSVSIPEGVTSVLSYAFSKTTNLKNITFPSSLESIADYAFYQSSIDHIRFHGDGPKRINEYCFHESTIKSIHFGRNLMILSAYAFHSCNELIDVQIDEDCMLSTITKDCFFKCSKLTNFIIPRNVLTIQETAFYICSSLTNVTFLKGSKINTIKRFAFAYCVIKEIHLPETITSLDGSIWVGNKELTKLTFDPNIKLNQIGPGDFMDCVKLTEVVIPASVQYFEPSVFSGCTSLMSINVNASNNNYKSIEGIVYTFNCSRLVACPCGRIEATVMKQVTVIGSNAFYLCKKLSNLIFEKDCKLERIEEGTFFSCIELRRVDLPTSLMTVERNAFYGCTKLETITFPDHSLCNLDHESVFAGCESLKDITFGRFCALTVFGQSTFSGCTKIEQITIPANCTTIGNNCFENCASLSNIVFEKGSQMQRVGDNAFIGCKSLVNYTIPDKSAYISNDMFGNAPSMINIIIPENTKLSSIKTNAFNNMNIESINFCKGSTVDVIEDSAFMSKQIKTFSIECPIIISSNAFMNCFNLTSINIPKATQIGNNAFSNCYKLSKLIIPDTCASFGEHSFENCTSLMEVGMNRISKLTTMSDFCFCQCSNLISVTIPVTVQYLGSFSFAKCRKLKTITFSSPSNLKTFGMYIFMECESLINFTIPDSINSITNKIFGNAPSIKNIFCS